VVLTPPLLCWYLLLVSAATAVLLPRHCCCRRRRYCCHQGLVGLLSCVLLLLLPQALWCVRLMLRPALSHAQH
jgi:hypothetical protein